MSLKLDVRVENELGGPSSSNAEVADRLRSIRDALGRDRMAELLGKVGEVYYGSIIERFKSHTGPTGQAWKRLKQRTILLKQRGMGKRPPAQASFSTPAGTVAGGAYNQLLWTGKLLRAVKVVVRKERSTVQIGVNSQQVPYAWAHQMGTERIPMRKFLGYTKKANTEAMRIIREYLVAQASASAK